MDVCTNANFKSVAGIERPKLFDLWVVAQKNKIEKETFSKNVKKILEF